MYKSLSSAMQYLQKTDDPNRLHKRADNYREDTLIVRIDDNWDLPQLEQAISDLQKAMLVLDEEINDIKSQLDEAKARHFKDHVWADADWWRRANAALRHKGRQRQSYQTTLGELNRRRRAFKARLNDWDDGRMFMNCAKSLLKPEEYERIWSEVHRRRME